MTDVAYRYLAPSTFRRADDSAELDLATSGGVQEHPHFFSGFVSHPDVVATALLALARVSRTRYYTPPNVVAAVLRAADPVVTSTSEGLRFEAFSVCCGVYARLDVLSAALDASHHADGVTNVDVNPPLRQALASLRASEPLHLDVGSDALRVRTMDADVVEEQVPLPRRWLKGFAETQVLSVGMTARHALDAAAARRFVQALPRTSPTKTVMWATPAMRSLRLASKPSRDAVCVAGPERLRAVEPLVRFATALTAYGPPVDSASLPAPSAWVLDLPGARLTIALSPEKARGFSGEGAVLTGLAGADVADDAQTLSALLAYEPRIDVLRLARDAAIDATRVQAALGALASSGQVGYDLTEGAYFHRPLPLSLDALAELHPRLADGSALADAGAVTGRDDGSFAVRSSGTDYLVRRDDDGWRCTCPWFAQYRGTRGPCKHVIAVHRTAETERRDDDR